jgi:hypothetical protein
VVGSLRGCQLRAFDRTVLRPRVCNITGVLLASFLSSAYPAYAQPPELQPLPARALPFDQVELTPDAPVIVLSEHDLDVLAAWTHDFAQWQAAFERWRHPKEPPREFLSWNEFLEHHPKPQPPSWLGAVCPLLEEDAQFANPCARLADWRDDPFLTKSRHATAAALQQQEAPKNSVWWRNLHLDGLWSTTQSNVAALGLFGTHLTVSVEGRLQVFVTPGILLVSVPTFYGSRVLSPATDWGLTYRLFNVGRSTVHFNLVQAWMLGGGAEQIAGTHLTLAGFSLTRRPRPN